jgi:hypothetical protein
MDFIFIFGGGELYKFDVLVTQGQTKPTHENKLYQPKGQSIGNQLAVNSNYDFYCYNNYIITEESSD